MGTTPKLSKLGRVYVDDDNRMCRIIDSSPNGWIALSEDGSTEELSDANLSMFFKSLLPTGIMNISLVDIGHNNLDVIVSLYRTADLSAGKHEPFVIGRQSVINFFAAQFATSMDEITYGLCISRLTSPPEFDMSIMGEYNNLIEDRIICLYPSDTVANIQELANPTDCFDSVINNFKVVFDPNGIKAVGSTLYEFLDNTGWQSEFNNAHGIIVLDDYVFEEDVESKLLYAQSDNPVLCNLDTLTSILEHRLNRRINIVDIAEYNPRYDIHGIDNGCFLLVRNTTDSPRVYIVKYVQGDRVVFVPKSQKLIASQLMDKLGRNL